MIGNVRVAMLLTLLAATTAHGLELRLTTTRAATITAPTGHGRLLLAFPTLSALREEWVTDATLTIPLGGGRVFSKIAVEVDALATSWGASPDWTTSWSTAGGDRVGTMSSDAELRPGSGATKLTIDVTDLARAMAAGEIAENGFILLPMNPQSVGFSEAELSIVTAAASGATLTIHYRKLTGLGYRGGPKALIERKRAARLE